MPKKSKIEVDKEISKLTKDLNVIKKSYNQGGFYHLIFEKIPNQLRIDKTTEKGRRVITAFYPESHDVYFMEYYEVGVASFPYGGIKVYNKSIGEYKLFYPDSVVKHKNLEFFTSRFD